MQEQNKKGKEQKKIHLSHDDCLKIMSDFYLLPIRTFI
jgi:hypothetical protein